MSARPGGARFARFGVFEADLQERALHRNGLKVSLQNQPFEVLAALLERPGETVTGGNSPAGSGPKAPTSSSNTACPRPSSRSAGCFRQSALQAESRDLLIRFGTAALLSSQLMLYSVALYAGYFQGIDAATKGAFEVIALALAALVIFYGGWPFIRGTIAGLRRMHFTMDSLIATGACSAFVYSLYEMTRGGEVYFDTAAMIVTLVLLGRYIESTAKGKAWATVQRLARLQPKEARIIRDAQAGMSAEETVPLSSVVPF